MYNGPLYFLLFSKLFNQIYVSILRMIINSLEKQNGYKIFGDAIYIFSQIILSTHFIKALREKKKIYIIESKIFKEHIKKIIKTVDELYDCGFEFQYIYIFDTIVELSTTD